MPARLVLALGLVALSLAAPSADGRWPQFRGADAGLAADNTALPETWGHSENVAWRVDVPGRGWSSPIVWGDHVFVTAVVDQTKPAEPSRPATFYQGRYLGGPVSGQDVVSTTAEHRWVVYDVDFKTGRIRWERTVRTGVPANSAHLKNSYASETPSTDGERVYAYFGNVGLFAFDMNGTPVWSKELTPRAVRSGWGPAGSPVLHKDRLYLVSDNDDQSFLAAFDARTGREIWRVDRDEKSNWSTPYVWVHDQRSEIVTSGSGGVRAYGLDGALLWTLRGMSSIHIPTPFARGGLLFVSSGYTGDALRPTYAVRPGASGDISLAEGETSNAHVAWSSRTLGPYNPSPLVYGGYYYTLLDRGFLTCNDAATGREIYGRQRLSADATGFTASPWAYNGRIFALSEDGDTYVIQAGPEFKVLGKNPLGEMSLATPAIAGDSVVLRTASKLVRVAKPSR